MKIFNNIREFFWPLLEKEDIQEFNEISATDIDVDDNHLEKVLDLTIKRYEAEEDRKKTIETKSSLFIGTISVITSVVIGITSVLINKGDFNLVTCFLVFLLFILTIYMTRTIWFSVQALERKNYYSISVDDFLISDKKEDYHKKIIAQIANRIKKNSITINSKVDSMTMAQEYFKRAIVIVTMYSFVILILFISKSNFYIYNTLHKLITLINDINLSGWNIIIIYTLIFTSLFIGIKGSIKHKK